MFDLVSSVSINKVVILTLLDHVSGAGDIFMKQCYNTLGQRKWMRHGCTDETEENEKVKVHLSIVALGQHSLLTTVFLDLFRAIRVLRERRSRASGQ